MISTRKAAQYVLTLGLVFAGGATCYAQSNDPMIQERPQEAGPATRDRDIQDRTVQQERMGDWTIVKERVVERRREGEVYVSGFGGFTWGHDYDNAEGTGSLKGAPIGSLGLTNSIVYGANRVFSSRTVELAWPGNRRVQFDAAYQRGFRLARVALARHDTGVKCDRPHQTRLQEP